MSEKWYQYGQFFGVDHPAVTGMLLQHVNVEEKIDGVRVAVRMVEDAVEVHPDLGAEDSFIQFLQGMQFLLNPEYVYVLEVMGATETRRAPRGGAIVMDVRGPEGWLDHEQKFQEAERIEFECAPLLYQGYVTSPEHLLGLMQQESLLGGTMQGMVIKPLSQQPGKLRFGKLVTPEYAAYRAFDRLPAQPGMDQYLQMAQEINLGRVNRPCTADDLAGAGEGSPVPDMGL